MNDLKTIISKIPTEYIIYTIIGILVLILILMIMFVKTKKKKPTQNSFNENSSIAGFVYDKKQDIFYSEIDAWQRKYGYCNFYDQIAPYFHLVADYEPIYFEYKEKRWLIELWKGQYGMTTGGEIGVYNIDIDKFNNALIKTEVIYNSIPNDALLPMSFKLYKNKKKFFTRHEKHWWLTGFKLGEFSEPKELEMHISITLYDKEMAQSFVDALIALGYSSDKFKMNGTIVHILFDKPHTKKSIPTVAREKAAQLMNKTLCQQYQAITGSDKTTLEKLEELKQKAPLLYRQIIKIGKPVKLYDQNSKTDRPIQLYSHPHNNQSSRKNTEEE